MAKSEPKSPVIVVAGPTASGKSRLALELAERFGGAVINADSMQVYGDLRILTARPDHAAASRAPHRLYGYLDAAERGSVAQWRELAVVEIERAHRAARLPIVVGGTGLYLRALRQGLAPVADIPDAIRAEAAALYDELGGEVFRARLAALDPDAATRLPPRDRQRLLRAWEVVRATGRPLSQWHALGGPAPPFRFATILLMPPRMPLYAACDARFSAMVQAGALDEAAALAARNLPPDLPAMKALGMPELIAHARGELPLGEAIAAAQRATRRYAKRQMTWFRHQMTADFVATAPFSSEVTEQSAAFIKAFLLTRRDSLTTVPAPSRTGPVGGVPSH